MAGRNTHTTRIEGRGVTIHASGAEGAPAVYVNVHSGDGSDIAEACAGIGCPPFDLVAISGIDWNSDLSPWPGDPVAGGGGFAGSADAHLDFIADSVVPHAESVLGAPSERVVAGYSMAGLFALYAPYRTDLFSRCVSASGSLWYPGFGEFAGTSGFVRRPSSAYLSVGDREAHTRDLVLRTVEECTRRLSELYAGMGVDTVLEINPGNHFRDAPLRLARGIAWTLGRMAA